MARYFNPSQITLVGRAFAQAERMAGVYFRLDPRQRMERLYDIKTLAFLEKHEVCEGAFAHLCKYQSPEADAGEAGESHFYRICLQDDRILDAVERAGSFIRLSPLLLYIAAHELVHVVRFEHGQGDFDAPEEEKGTEEERVHRITRHLLKPVIDTDLNLVLDCFSDRYRIGDLMQ